MMSWIERVTENGKQVWTFLKRPNDVKQAHSNTAKFKYVLGLLVIAYLLIIPSGVLVYFLDEMQVIDLPDHKLEDYFQDKSIGMVVFLAVILAPFIEELIFRGFITLRRCYPVLIVIEFLAGRKRSKFIILRKVKRSWRMVFPFIAWLSILAFGFVHATNFEGAVPFWLVPLITLPQLILGVFLTFIRVRYGLIWSMLLHAMGNLLAVLISLQDLLQET